MSDWVALSVVVDRSDIEAIAQLFQDCNANGFEEAPPDGLAPVLIQPWETDRRPPVYSRVTLRTWLDKEDLAQAKSRLETEHPHLELTLEEVKEEDWAESWKAHHHRIQITENLAVSPPWEAEPGDLIIPPGNAFGTGEHPSTFECLRKIVMLSSDSTQCLDVGCGSGILALAAARLGLNARGIDIDRPSVLSAQENAQLNGLKADFSNEDIRLIQGEFDLVVANLFAEVLVELANELVRVSSRHLVLAGILTEKVDMVLEALHPMTLEERIESDAWTCLHLVHP